MPHNIYILYSVECLLLPHFLFTQAQHTISHTYIQPKRTEKKTCTTNRLPNELTMIIIFYNMKNEIVSFTRANTSPLRLEWSNRFSDFLLLAPVFVYTYNFVLYTYIECWLSCIYTHTRRCRRRRIHISPNCAVEFPLRHTFAKPNRKKTNSNIELRQHIHYSLNNATPSSSEETTQHKTLFNSLNKFQSPYWKCWTKWFFIFNKKKIKF